MWGGEPHYPLSTAASSSTDWDGARKSPWPDNRGCITDTQGQLLPVWEPWWSWFLSVCWSPVLMGILHFAWMDGTFASFLTIAPVLFGRTSLLTPSCSSWGEGMWTKPASQEEFSIWSQGKSPIPTPSSLRKLGICEPGSCGYHGPAAWRLRIWQNAAHLGRARVRRGAESWGPRSSPRPLWTHTLPGVCRWAHTSSLFAGSGLDCVSVTCHPGSCQPTLRHLCPATEAPLLIVPLMDAAALQPVLQISPSWQICSNSTIQWTSFMTKGLSDWGSSQSNQGLRHLPIQSRTEAVLRETRLKREWRGQEVWPLQLPRDTWLEEMVCGGELSVNLPWHPLSPVWERRPWSGQMEEVGPWGGDALGTRPANVTDTQGNWSTQSCMGRGCQMVHGCDEDTHGPEFPWFEICPLLPIHTHLAIITLRSPLRSGACVLQLGLLEPPWPISQAQVVHWWVCESSGPF